MNGESASRVAAARSGAHGPDLSSDLDERAATQGLALFKGNLTAGIVATNEAFDAFPGFGVGPTRGWDWLQAVQEADRARLRRALEAAGTTGSRSAFPVRVQVRPGVIEQVRVVVAGLGRPGTAGFFAGTLDLPSADATPGVHGGDRPGRVAVAADGPRSASSDVDPYEVLLDALPHAIAYVAPDGTIEFANTGWTERTASRVGDRLADVFDAGAGISVAPLSTALARGEAWQGTVPIADRVLTLVCAPIADAVGGGAVLALSDGIASERPLAAVIEPFCRLIDATPDCGAIFSPDGELLAINDATRRVLGIDGDVEPHAGLLETLTFDDGDRTEFAPRVRDALMTTDWLVARGEICGGDLALPATMLVFSIRDDLGEHRASLCIARDETEVRDARSRVDEREEWFQALVQHSSMMVAVVDAEWSVRFLSPACREMFDLDVEDRLGPEVIELVEPDDREALQESVARVREAGGQTTVRYRLRRRDGAEAHVETRIENLLDDPIVAGLVLTTRDVTDVTRAARAQEQSERALRTLVEAAPVAILATDDQGRVLAWNPACESLFGWPAEGVLGRTPPFLSEDQWASPVFVEATQRLLSGERCEAIVPLHRRDGDDVVVALATSPVGDADDPSRTFVTVAVDITLRARAAEELERRAEVDRLVAALSRTLVDATCETIERRIVDALDVLVRRLDARAAAVVVGTDDLPRYTSSTVPTGGLAVDPDVSGAFVVDDELGNRGGWIVVGEHGAIGRVMVEWEQAPGITRDELEPLEVVAASLVVAIDRADADRERRDRGERLRALAEHATDFVMVISPDLEIRYLSPATGRFLAMNETDRFDPEHPIVHEDDRELVLALLREVVTDGPGAPPRELVARMRRADGAFRRVEMVVSNLTGVTGVEGIVINGRDVTDGFEMAARIGERERELQGIVRNLAEGVIVLDAKGAVKYASPTAARLVGFEVREGQGRLGLDFVVEEDRERVAEILARAYTEPGVHGPIRLRVRGADGIVRVLEAIGRNGLDDPEVQGVIVTTRDVTEQLAAEEAAQRSDARLAALVEKVSDVITIVGRDGEIVYTSPAANRLFGFVDGDESHTDPMARMHPDDREAAAASIADHITAGSTEPVRFRLQAADGSWHWVETVVQDLTDDESVGGLVVTTRDVSDRQRAESLVADQAEVLTLVARGAPLRETLEAVCTVLERNSEEMFGVFLIGNERRQVRLIAGPSMPVELADACRDLTIEAATSILGRSLEGERSVHEIDRETVVLPEVVLARQGVRRLAATPILDSVGQRVIGVIAAMSREDDVEGDGARALVEMFAQTAAIAVERWAAEELLAHRANHDSLTGLPNRVLFLEFLARSLSRAARDGSTLAVLFMDLDRFKHVNDGLGHDAGDVLLRILADRLREQMRPSDVVARFGGDEFTVLCEGLDPAHAAEQARELAERLLETIEIPASLDGEDRRLSASLGIAIATPDSTPESILRDADAAMYEAKQRGKARFEIFDDAMRSTMHRRLDLEARLERAIHNDEFRLFLQPIVDLRTGRCVGGEALLRWQDPQLGLVAPDVFIGLAEETGLIIPMGEWALAEACRTVARWEQVGLLPPDFVMAVNLSARQVAQADLVRRVSDVIARSGAHASRLCLEITETVLMEESSVAMMNELKGLGVRLSIDDFGTGYSSLGYLKRFPVDSVKVDRSFVDGLGTEHEDSAIVAAVVSLGHALGLSVVAEGVETSGQLRALVELGCDRAQGYWFSGPRNAFEFAGLLNEQPWENGRDDWRP